MTFLSNLIKMLPFNWSYMGKQRTLKGIRLRSQVSVQAKQSWATKWFPVTQPINRSDVDRCEHRDSTSVLWKKMPKRHGWSMLSFLKIKILKRSKKALRRLSVILHIQKHIFIWFNFQEVFMWLHNEQSRWIFKMNATCSTSNTHLYSIYLDWFPQAFKAHSRPQVFFELFFPLHVIQLVGS